MRILGLGPTELIICSFPLFGLLIVGVVTLIIRVTRRSDAVFVPAVTTTSPPGWFADPKGLHQLRYWNGTEWTSSVSDNGQQSYDEA